MNIEQKICCNRYKEQAKDCRELKQWGKKMGRYSEFRLKGYGRENADRRKMMYMDDRRWRTQYMNIIDILG